MAKAPKKAKEPVTDFDFILSNGDWFAKLRFSGSAEVRRLFKKCKIKGSTVYLA